MIDESPGGAGPRHHAHPAAEDWLREHLRHGGAYGALLALILTSVVFAVAAPEADWARILGVVFQGATLLMALWTSRAGRRPLHLAEVAVAVALVSSAISLTGAGDTLSTALVHALSGLLVVFAPIAIGRDVLRRVVRHRTVTVETVLGVVCIYLLIGMLFAFSYGVAAAADPDPFFAQGATENVSDFVYFSFVTLTTVGYGDLTAANDLARSLAIIEALMGQLYLVTIVGVFVGNVGRARPRSAP